MKTQPENKKQHKSKKAFDASCCGETNTSFTQSVGITGGESYVRFPAQKMALMGCEIIRRDGSLRAAGVTVCRWQLIYA